MAAPTISNTYTATQDSNTTSVNVTVNGSSEFAEGDLLIVWVEIDGNQSTSGVSLTESGFTEVFELQGVESGQENILVLYHKTLTAGDTSLTQIQANWSDSNEKACISVHRIAAAEHSGVDVTASSDQGVTTTPSSPSVTTTVDDCLVVIAEGHDGGATSTHPSGTTELSDLVPTGGGIVTLSVAHFTQATAGATGAKQWTLANGRSTMTGTIAVKPVATITGAITDGAKAGDTQAAVGTFPRSVSDGAKAGDTQAGVGTFPRSVSDGSKAGDTITTGLLLDKSTSEGAKAGDSASEVLTRVGAISDGAKAGETFSSSILSLLTNLAEGAAAGDSFGSILTLPLAFSEGAKAGDAMTASLTGTADGVATVSIYNAINSAPAFLNAVSGTPGVKPS